MFGPELFSLGIYWSLTIANYNNYSTEYCPGYDVRCSGCSVDGKKKLWPQGEDGTLSKSGFAAQSRRTGSVVGRSRRRYAAVGLAGAEVHDL